MGVGGLVFCKIWRIVKIWTAPDLTARIVNLAFNLDRALHHDGVDICFLVM